ncbi:hypothetical protein [Falsiroseomonas sp. CW058]|uniref:hypothetical protein n=1 Tax=Falsiroseomonas sp. CW058 TaxID=3388664 RepID=UPI003D319ABE
MGKKPELSAGLVAIKGNAAPAPDMPTRASPPPAPAPAAQERPQGEAIEPLNFKVPARFRREFKTYAAAHGMKLNELLQRSFEAYRKQQND